LKSNDLKRTNTKKKGIKPPPGKNIERIVKLKNDFKEK